MGKEGHLEVAGDVPLEVNEPSVACIIIEYICDVVAIEQCVIVKACRLFQLSWLALQDYNFMQDTEYANVAVTSKTSAKVG